MSIFTYTHQGLYKAPLSQKPLLQSTPACQEAASHHHRHDDGVGSGLEVGALPHRVRPLSIDAYFVASWGVRALGTTTRLGGSHTEAAPPSPQGARGWCEDPWAPGTHFLGVAPLVYTLGPPGELARGSGDWQLGLQ